MKSWTTPTPEQVQRAVALLKNEEQLRYFFDKLENPLWLEPLLQQGFFDSPPKPILVGDGKNVKFPVWPASQYLSRVASGNPEVARRIALHIETENPVVWADLADTARALPPSSAIEIAIRIKQRVESGRYSFPPFDEAVVQLTGALATGGELERALELALPLLRLTTNQRRGLALPEPKFNPWYYEEMTTEIVPILVAQGGPKALWRLCELLNEASLSRIEGTEEDSGGPTAEDYSYVWRPAIEDHPRNSLREPVFYLIDSIRNGLEALATSNPSLLGELVTGLDRFRAKVFKRLGLHLLRGRIDWSPQLLEERLLDRAALNDLGLHHEYYLLLSEGFGSLPPEAQTRYLTWIDEGPPDLEQYRTWRQQRDGAEFAESSVERFADRWRLQRLAPISKNLDEKWRARVDTLDTTVGPVDDPYFETSEISEGGFVGWTSPVPKEAMLEASDAELLQTLRTWEPSPASHLQDASREGLARELKEAVTTQPERFDRLVSTIVQIDPLLAREAIEGYRQATRNKTAFDRAAALAACLIVARQPAATESQEGDRWTEARLATTGLVTELLGTGKDDLSLDHRHGVWAVIQALHNDRHPTVEGERQLAGGGFDPATAMLNTVRSRALEASIRYGLWVREGLQREVSAPSVGLHDMPELREVLEQHLEPSREPSLAVRAVYGQWMPWLFLLDDKWTRAVVARVFSADPQMYGAAWVTYIKYSRPYSGMIQLLEAQYRSAIEKLDETALEPDDEHRALASHLMAFYWRGELHRDNLDELVHRFFAKASKELRAHALDFIGESLARTQESIEQPVLARLRELWEQRVSFATTNADGDKELTSFTSWFESGKFEPAWALEQLRFVVEAGSAVDYRFDSVFDRLTEYVRQYPVQVVGCLYAIVEGALETWVVSSNRDEIRNILIAALDSGDREAVQLVRETLEAIGRRGDLTFRDLASRPS